jgi:hypothetical protein
VRYSSGGLTVTVDDNLNGGVDWTQDGLEIQANDSNGELLHFSYPNSAAGACTVTVAFGPPARTLRFIISEFSGAATSSPLDQAKTSAEGISTSLAAGAQTPSVDGCLLYCSGANASADTFTAGTDFTKATACPDSIGNERIFAEYFIQTTAANHDGTCSFDNARNWACLLTVYKPLGGGGLIFFPFPFRSVTARRLARRDRG